MSAALLWFRERPRRASDTFSRHHPPQAEFDFQTLIDKLPADEPRYFVLDWTGTTSDDRHIDKIFFVSWVPDTCKAKTKMLYASSKQALRNALDGVQLDHQATDYDEVTPEEFNERSGV
jgi:cofilin